MRTVTIPLTKGKAAVVDARDAKRVSQYKWYTSDKPKTSQTCYATTKLRVNGKRTRLCMHRFIVGAPAGKQVDHIDGDGLNNTRRNLRFVTNSQNQYNLHARRSNTGLLGVYKVKVSNNKKNPYKAMVQVDGKLTHLGYFDNRYEAAAAYDRAKKIIAGEYGSYNFDALLTTEQLRRRIYKSNGFFSVTIKSRTTGRIRIMTARRCVTKHLRGGQLRFDPHKKRLIECYDMQKRAYRMINIDGIVALKTGGKYYGRVPKQKCVRLPGSGASSPLCRPGSKKNRAV